MKVCRDCKAEAKENQVAQPYPGVHVPILEKITSFD